jgi:phenylalanyl-tRNA synthetase alpha subunit
LRNVVFYLRSYDYANANVTNIKGTVTAVAATVAASEQARFDDEYHQYTDPTPDTRDVGATYENIQLE